jgi:hypothetical protein
MARVKVNTEVGCDDEGIPFVSTAYHLYCDRCGSFRISAHVSPAKYALIGLFVAGAAGIWYQIMRGRLSGATWLGWWLIFLAFTLPVLHGAWTHLGHRCGRCGSTRISRRDVFDYTSSARLPYDLPPDKLHKHKLLSDELEAPPSLLAPFLLLLMMLLFPIMVLVGVAGEVCLKLKAVARRWLSRILVNPPLARYNGTASHRSDIEGPGMHKWLARKSA